MSGSKKEVQARSCRDARGGLHYLPPSEMKFTCFVNTRRGKQFLILTQFNEPVVYFVRQRWGELLLNLSMSRWHGRLLFAFNFHFYVVVIEKEMPLMF